MIFIGTAGLIVGVLLARRFSVFILLPVVLAASPATLLMDVAVGHKVSQGLLAAVYLTLTLQIGFLVGIFGSRWCDVRRRSA